MRRLCIYVTYDFENIADDYIGYMLHELRKVVDCLVVVCNYEYIVKGINNIQPYADKIYYRKNIGFDAGAYKDTLCQYIGWDEICDYEELLLINDSFYGPIYSIEDLFNVADDISADYWGLTRAPKGKLNNEYVYDSHIQSYFIAFRKNILQSIEFKKYWRDMVYAQSLLHAIIIFELGFNRLLKDMGFVGIAITDLIPLKCRMEENENPYMQYPFELICDIKLPIFKRKSLKLENTNFDDALRAFDFIDNNSDYDAKLISDHLLRLEKKINIMGLEKFCDIHSNIYIYGAGIYGKNLARYFDYRGWLYKSFLVTDAENQYENCSSFDRADIKNNDGIIIAVGNEKVFWEIMDTIKKRCNINQIFNPKCVL